MTGLGMRRHYGKNPDDRSNKSSHGLHPSVGQRHLGTFGDASKGYDPFCAPEQSFAQDLASAVAMVAFLASAVVVLAGVFSVGVPV